jgi:hypothetical protein
LIVFRIWLAGETALGLLAQRLFTVSTAFESASVVEVREIAKLYSHVCPPDEMWFEVVVDVRSRAFEGGLVAPGAHA